MNFRLLSQMPPSLSPTLTAILFYVEYCGAGLGSLRVYLLLLVLLIQLLFPLFLFCHGLLVYVVDSDLFMVH